MTRGPKPVPPPKYEAKFEEIWSAIGNGTKSDAQKAWQQVARPEPSVILPAWARWKAVAWPDGIGVPYTATWLRSYDWREEPRPRPGKVAGMASAGRPPPPPVRLETPKETRRIRESWGNNEPQAIGDLLGPLGQGGQSK
jgi:hypothetical protein